MNIFAIANQKGGVGKTITTLNLGYALANMGKRTLLIDLDPQSSLTQALGVTVDNTGSLADVMGNSRPGRLALRAIIRTIAPNLDLAPGDLELSNTELGLPARMGREGVLKKALATIAGYDIALIDCPPSMGVLTIAGLAACHGVISPVTPDALGLRGLSMFLISLESIKSELNPALKFIGALMTQYDKRQTLHQAALGDLEAAGIAILGTLPRRSEAARTAGAGQPSTDLAADYKLIAEKLSVWQND